MATIITSTTNSDVRPIYRGTQVVWYILYLVEILLLFRFALKLLGANPAGFTNFIYAATYPLVAPFLYVINPGVVSGSVFDWSTLLAMLVYWLIAVAIVKLFLIGKPVSNTEAQIKLNREEEEVM